MKITLKAALWVVASCGTLLGQTTSKVWPQTFRVEGRISSAFDSLPGGVNDKGAFIPLPRTEVTFCGERTTKTVTVDDKGFYQAELAFGVYKMTAQGPKLGHQVLTPYARLFRVKSPGTVVLNGALYMEHMTCDIVVGGTPKQQLEETKNLCGGEDKFPIPAKDGTPLELYIRYSNRDVSDQGYRYGGGRHPNRVPVFVAYNLFALEADGVSYDRKNETITAVGKVVTEDGSGKVQHFGSVVFRIEDGQAVPLKAPNRLRKN